MTDAADDPVADTPRTRPVTSSRTVFRSGRVIDVRTDAVTMDDGTAYRDVVVHPGAVGIIAIDDDERVLLIQQYRHPIEHMLWEPPAGLLDVPDEPPWEAAKRELYEEAHVEADRWDLLVDVFTSPGMTNEVVRIYLARDVRPSQRERHTGEHEEVDLPTRWVPLAELADSVLGGNLHNPIAVSGVLAAVHARGNGWKGLRSADAPFPEMSRFRGSRRATSEAGTGETGTEAADNGVSHETEGRQ